MKKTNTDTAAQEKDHFTNEECPRRSQGRKRYLSIKELSKEYQMSLRVIYSLIKRDSSFPYVNMGLKKKFMVDREAFETWIFKRTYKEQSEVLNIPTIEELTQNRR